MAIIGQTLEAIYSKRDRFGNCHWALRYTNHTTGQFVCGKICGGESNIKGILMHWGNPDGWDRSVSFDVLCLSIRDFNRLVKDWEYLGCRPEDLAAAIRSRLVKIEPDDDIYGYDDKDAIVLTEIDWIGGNDGRPKMVYVTPENAWSDGSIQDYLVVTFGVGTTGYVGLSPDQIRAM